MKLLLLGALAVFITGGTKERPEIRQAVSVCIWQRCGFLQGAFVDCEAEERGTATQLAGVVEATAAGAVRWSCEPTGNLTGAKAPL